MNRITNVNIDNKNNKMSFQVILDTPTTITNATLVIDELWNVDKIYNDDVNEHSYYFKLDDNIELLKVTDTAYNITIEIPLFNYLTKHIKYIGLISDEITVGGIYYTSELIYDGELTNLKKMCSTCLDDKCLQLIAYVTFKKLLLELAIELNKHKDAINLYVDICKLLKIDINVKCVNDSLCSTCNCCLK